MLWCNLIRVKLIIDFWTHRPAHSPLHTPHTHRMFAGIRHHGWIIPPLRKNKTFWKKFRILYCKNNENSAKIRMFSDNLILFSPFPQNLPLKNGAFGNFDNIDFLEEYLPVSSHSHSHMRPVWGCPDCVLWFQKLPEHKPTSPAFPGRDRERATGWDHSIIHTLTIMSHCKINLSTGSRIAYLIVDVVCKCTRCHVTDSFFS